MFTLHLNVYTFKRDVPCSTVGTDFVLFASMSVSVAGFSGFAIV